MNEILRVSLIIAGLLHFSLLLAGLSMPRVLRWNQDLTKVDPFTRQVILVHGLFIVLTIIGFGVVTLIGAEAMVQGSALGAAIAGFIGLFWLSRLGIAVFYFKPGRWLSTTFRKLGYGALTCVFTYFSLVYLTTAWINLKIVFSS